MLSEPVIIALITAIPPTLVAFISLIVALQSRKRIGDIHLQINSRMDQLLQSEKGKSLVEGRVEGIASERANPQTSVK